MNTTTIPTAELTGAALDWAVAHVEGLTKSTRFVYVDERCEQCALAAAKFITDAESFAMEVYSPSTNWAQGGPIIERENITICDGTAIMPCEYMHLEEILPRGWGGQTMLIAAMRAYVAVKLGDQVEVPQEPAA